MAKLAKIIIEEGQGEKKQYLFVVPFLMFIIKMFDGIVDKSTEPLLLDFTVTGEERELAIILLAELIQVRSNDANQWADTLILTTSFLKRITA